MMLGRFLKLQILVLLVLTPLAASAANHAVLYVVDSSGSMWSKVENTEKVYMARDALSAAISRLPVNIDVGLIAYGHRKKGDCNDVALLAPPGSPRASIIKKINSFTPKGMTPLSNSIDMAVNQLKSRGGKGTVVFLSDGAETCKRDPCKAALAAGEDIRIHVVGFGVKSYDVSQLNCVAQNGGGKYFSANSESSLKAALALVASEIANDDRSSVKAATTGAGAAGTVAVAAVATSAGAASKAASEKAAAEKAAAEKAAAEKAAAEKAAAEKAAAEKAAAEKAAADKAAAEKAAAEKAAAEKAAAEKEAAEKAAAEKAAAEKVAAEKAAAEKVAAEKAAADKAAAEKAAAEKAAAEKAAAEKAAAEKAAAEKAAAEKAAAEKAAAEKAAAEKAAAEKAAADKAAAEKAAAEKAAAKAEVDRLIAEQAAAKAEADRIAAEKAAAAKAEADRLAAEKAAAAKAEAERVAAEKAAAKAEADRLAAEKAAAARAEAERVAAEKAAAKAEADRLAAEKAAAARAEAERVAAEKAAAAKAERERIAAEKAAAARAEAARIAAFDDDSSWGRDVVQKKPGIIYSDDFSSGYLSEHWQVVNPVSALLHNDNGNLILMTKKSSLTKGTVPNLLVLNHEAVRGDYSVTIKMESEFSTGKVGNTKQEAGLLFYAKNRESLGLVVSNEKTATFPKCRGKNCRQVVRVDLITILDDARTRIGTPFMIAWQPPGSTAMATRFTVHLKVSKVGFEYAAFASLDGKEWHNLGKVPVYGSELNPALYASSNSNYPYALVKFDDMMVRRDEN